MTRDELAKAFEELPKVKTNNSISAMNAINVDDLMNAVDRFNKIPNYNDLLKENQELKKQVEELSKNYNLDVPWIYIASRNDAIIRLDKKALEYLRSLEQKNHELEKQYEKVLNDYCRLDAQNKTQQKVFIKYLENEIERKRLNATCTTEYNDYVVPLKHLLQKFKEITGVSDDKTN